LELNSKSILGEGGLLPSPRFFWSNLVKAVFVQQQLPDLVVPRPSTFNGSSHGVYEVLKLLELL